MVPLPCRNADVAEQIEHLRGHLLRSEQDNELMRVKLEEEKAEREKAQKQAELAKKMMLQQGREESGSKKHNRRETWCPGGKSGWAPPPMSAGAQQAVPRSNAVLYSQYPYCWPLNCVGDCLRASLLVPVAIRHHLCLQHTAQKHWCLLVPPPGALLQSSPSASGPCCPWAS